MYYTVIYSDYFSSGSHMHSVVHKMMVELKDSSETVTECIERNGLDINCVHFIFHGWVSDAQQT